ncbi:MULTISPECIES: restriction endonuclease subunit S [Acinetobacter]|uniref:Restriction endonuclease subunit S n=1 Tax=Acinetobacter bereziniae TaxID=106648 RepID=A0A7T4TVI5_ACIBZ|nr:MULTISPECIES: restriction endonuclease subunit S [Acinetobacter]WDM41701.1 restriction endonuclease subunit S [Acinetobacter nosocomialis]AZM37909.1 restriction endonuclease subunit S [Acinetobacter baumannii]MDQ8975642.1 restriction endonuclease subunit S [Acinetobacter johnsonii]NWK60607.1 restriction endonuclease subunit S [Acinetobacter sp. SwsAc2]QJF29766.1 restriction endonuclease subunit S [Acinetobacter baumannii]
MSEWQQLSLGSLMEIIGGGTPKTSVSEYWGGDIPWLSVVDFNTGLKFVSSTEKTITQEGLNNSSTKLLNKGDIIISARGTVGVLAILDKPMTFNQSCYGIRSKKGISDTDYLYYLLTDTVRELTQISHGGVFDTITRATFDEIEVPVPPLPEQKAIASVLSSLDDKIDLLHRQNKTLEAMAETLFRQWFIEDETLAEVVVSELIEFNPKRSLSKGTDAIYLEMAGLSTQSFNATGYYRREFSSGTKFVQQDTLLARITPCLENGKAGYVTFLNDNEVGWGSTEYIVMRPKAGIHPLMAYVLCRNQDFKDYAESCMEGSSGRQRVNVDHLKEFTIGKPDDEVVKQFNDYLQSIESKLMYNSKQIQTLENLRDTLLPKLMSGEVRVQYQTEEVA